MREKSDSNTDFFADDVTSAQVERLSDGEYVIVMTHSDGADSNIRTYVANAPTPGGLGRD